MFLFHGSSVKSIIVSFQRPCGVNEFLADSLNYNKLFPDDGLDVY